MESEKFNLGKKKDPELSETGAPLDEFNFYQDRFTGMAERHNNRAKAKGASGVTGRLADKFVMENDKSTRPKTITPLYVMQEQAERENLDRDRLLDQERHEWDEMLKPVIQILKEKRDNSVESKKHKVIVYALGGGLRGPYGAGQVLAFDEMGLTADKVDVLVGASAGMADLTYWASGQAPKGTSIYYDECTSKEFIDLSRVKQVLDVSVAGNAMRSGEKAVDQKRIMEIPTEVYALNTPVNSTKAELVDIKTAKPDMISAVEASMNVRLLKAPGIDVNGIKMEDGSFGTFEINQLIDRFQEPGKELTILVLPNLPFRKLSEVPEPSSMLDQLPNTGSLGTIKKFTKLAGELRKTMIDCKEKQGVSIGIMWPPDRGLDVLDADADLIKMAVMDTVRDTIKQFGEKQPESVELYIPEKDR
jgi:predicted patatin/cPLA2 family phospholipase